MSPAEAAIREALAKCAREGSPELYGVALEYQRALLSELDALRAERDKIEADLESLQDSFGQLQAANVKLRARCEAGDAMLHIVSQWRPRRPEHIFNAIDAHLK